MPGRRPGTLCSRMAVPREDACGAYASLALPAAKHRGRVWEPSQYRPRPKAGSFRRETWQPLTRLAALGDLSPLRSAPRGEVVSGQGSTEGGRPGSARHATPGGYASGAHALPCEARGRARLQSLTRFLFLDCVRAVRRTSARISRSPSLSMRQLRVDGLSPRMTAAPPVPVMRPCVWCKTSAM